LFNRHINFIRKSARTAEISTKVAGVTFLTHLW